MKQEVNVTEVTQTANSILGTTETKKYFLIIGQNEKKVVINIGQKTFNSIKELNGKS